MKRTNLIVMTVGFFVLLASVFAQNMPPKAGTYYCYTTSYNGNGLDNPVQVTPAFFGNIILDGKGNYRVFGHRARARADPDCPRSAR